MGTPSLILASNSPRRRQMLAWTGWTYQVSAVEIDETPHTGEDPAAYVARLARAKALARAAHAIEGNLILAADTIVADERRLLGKPATAAEAFAMLQSLRGRTHQVFTAIHLMALDPPRSVGDCCRADVPMRAYSDDELHQYVASGDPLDKAGGYAIQHRGFHPVENFQGCYACVVGLPLCHLVRSMASLGYTPPQDVPAACQANLHYDCPVFPAILAGEDG